MEHTKECLAGGYCNCARELQNEIKTEEVIEGYCEECKCFHNMHHITCSKLSEEEKLERLIKYYDWTLTIMERNKRTRKSLIDKITFWQGKFNILRQENNALRKKLNKLKQLHLEAKELKKE